VFPASCQGLSRSFCAVPVGSVP